MDWLRRAFLRTPAGGGAAAAATEWKQLGNTALAADDFAEAARCYEQGVQANPEDAALLLNLGFVLLEQGAHEAARGRLAQAVERSGRAGPLAHEALYLLGRSQRLLGHHAQALASFTRAVELRADFAEPMQEAFALLKDLRRHEEALAWAQRWVRAAGTPQARLALAHALFVEGHEQDALLLLDALLAADPGDTSAREARGPLLLAVGRPLEALADFDYLLARSGPSANLLCGRAEALRGCGQLEDALAVAVTAVALDGEHRLARASRIGILKDLFRLGEAEQALTEAIAIFPQEADLRWQRAMVRLLAGKLEEAWPDYETRWQAPAAGVKITPPDYNVPRWTGHEPLEGRSILVLPEQGLGDAIQFARYIPLLQERGARVMFQVPAVLHPLFRTAFPGCELVAEGGVRRPDFQCFLMSLPLAFRTSLTTVPARIPYLHAEPGLLERWQQQLGPSPGLRVGVVWSGGMAYGNDASRSIALARFREIDFEGVQFVSLQKEVRDRDRAALREWTRLLHVGNELQSFADTAAVASLTDVVVSVDTSVAHLAGGLGRPLWVLLPHHPDWRWMLDRTDTPWYPTARVFRQPAPGDWGRVLAGVKADLEALARAR